MVLLGNYAIKEACEQYCEATGGSFTFIEDDNAQLHSDTDRFQVLQSGFCAGQVRQR